MPSLGSRVHPSNPSRACSFHSTSMPICKALTPSSLQSKQDTAAYQLREARQRRARARGEDAAKASATGYLRSCGIISSNEVSAIRLRLVVDRVVMGGLAGAATTDDPQAEDDDVEDDEEEVLPMMSSAC